MADQLEKLCGSIFLTEGGESGLNNHGGRG
jgi:hypothetical protein